MIRKSIACFNKDENIRFSSSSGGVYTLLANEIINSGGTVYAACYDHNLNVVHMPLKCKEEIKKGQGAKYVASRLENVFQSIYHDLMYNEKVLFVGLPCQCAGLLSFLSVNEENRINIDNLFLADMICHGVSGEKTWKMFIKEEEGIKHAKINSVNMRDKSNGWTGYQWRIVFSNNQTIIESKR